jgi:hypothetical protein
VIADWTVEVGPGCPVIELPWPGWVDLRHGASRAAFAILDEVRNYPELGDVLRVANHGEFATAKVDVFPVDRSEADPEIAEEPFADTACGIGSYLDVLWLGDGQTFAACEAVSRLVAASLKHVSLPRATAEIVVRAARLYHQNTFGWTLYAVGFGPDAEAARQCWAAAAEAVIAAFRTSVNTPLWASSSIG